MRTAEQTRYTPQYLVTGSSSKSPASFKKATGKDRDSRRGTSPTNSRNIREITSGLFDFRLLSGMLPRLLPKRRNLCCNIVLPAVVACSLIAPLAEAAAPAITSQPTDLTVFYGDPAAFRVEAAGTEPLSYQWFRNGAPVTDAQSQTYSLLSVSAPDDHAVFTVQITNSYGSVTSAPATLTVDFGLPGPAQTNRVLEFASSWKFNQTENLDGKNWTAPEYDDSGWPSGPGLLAAESAPEIVPLIGTFLDAPGQPTPGLGPGHAYYFRTSFVAPAAHSVVPLLGTFRCDDGAVVYLNGDLVRAVRMPPGQPLNGTFATDFPPFGGSDASGDEYITDFSGAIAKPGTNVIAVSVHQANAGSSDIVWGLALDLAVYSRVRDTVAPAVVDIIPAPGIVPALTRIEVHFSEAVKNVTAGSLLVNSRPATNLVQFAPDAYVFYFPPPPAGEVQVAWSGSQAIIDASANSNGFAGGTFSYTLDPTAITSSVVLTEFMAGNERILDDLGQYSDWIELYNTGESVVDLGGWYLTDDPTRLTKWRFPAATRLPARSYLLVWASGEDRTNSSAPLHTSFKLDKSADNFLGLVYSDGATIVSAFPVYPRQYDNISYGRDRLDPTVAGYFLNPTPGAANATLGTDFEPEVRFSRSSGTFQEPFNLTLQCSDAAAVIRYVIVTNTATAALQNVPNSSSPVYSGPIPISESTQVRARAFPTDANRLPGPPTSHTYIQVTTGAASFKSSLPIVLFHNFGGGTPPATTDQSAVMMVFSTGLGLASMSNPPDLVKRVGINIRGRSTQGLPKGSYAVETWDEFNDDDDVELLGLPAESDWVFYAPNSFDKPLIHNPFIHQLSREIGRYSPRTRIAEVFTSFSAGPVAYNSPGSGNYFGIYVIEEKIKGETTRVDIDRLQPGDTNSTSITGGYLLKVDSQDADERALYAGSQAMVYVEPSMEDYGIFPGRALQDNYIGNYIENMYSAMIGPNPSDPQTGYPAWIDVDSWIDHHILNVLALNADALRLSGYFFKNRGKKMEMGPLWDFDRALGTSTSDWRPYNPRTWMASNALGGGDYGTDFFNPGNVYHNPWYSLLFYDLDFWQRWIDRWQELRTDRFAETNLVRIVDELAAQVAPAHQREIGKWAASQPRSGRTVPPDGSYSYTFPGTYQGEIDFMKLWLHDRLEFIDGNFLAPPVLSRSGGPISAGSQVTLTSPGAPAGTRIYYTLNGQDPRQPGGGFLPAAVSGTAPITITVSSNTRIVARHYNPNHQNLTGFGNPPLSSSWSGPVAATFVVATPSLAVTEIMYHPSAAASDSYDAENFEFIELKNVGAASLILPGVRFTRGIDFTFSPTNAVTSLAPGEYLVLVANRTAFALRYPGVTAVAGEYSGRLDNGGESLVLEGALQEPIADFRYKDNWHGATDGHGFSLVLRDEQTSPATPGDASSWRASSAIGGSPGRADLAPTFIPPVVINEALTHTDPPAADTIELYNPTASPVSIGGWYLTDEDDEPRKFMIPAGTTIEAGGYIIFTENDFNSGPNGFGLSSLGESIYLFSGDGAALTGYRHGLSFGPQANSATFGRYVSSDGREHFVTTAAPTLGGPNTGPKVGPVVINEIMFAPPSSGLDPNTLEEFIELRNTTSEAVSLYDPAHPTNSWSLDGAIEFHFPSGFVIPSGGYVLVTSFDPVAQPEAVSLFRARYGLDSSTVLVGPWQGRLANEGESLRLLYPDNPQVAPAPNPGFVPQILAEEVDYSPQPRWPTNTVNSSNSLQRISGSAFGNDPASWRAALPTPGRANQGATETDADHDGLPDEWEVAHGLNPNDSSGENGSGGDPDADLMSNYEEFVAGTDPRNGQERLGFASATLQENTIVLRFIAQPGRVYTVEGSASLAPSGGAWEALADNLIGNGFLTVSDPVMEVTRFYRLKVRLE